MLEAFQGRQGSGLLKAPALSQLAGCVHQRLRRLLEAGLSQDAFDLLTKAWSTYNIPATVTASDSIQHYNPLVETQPYRHAGSSGHGMSCSFEVCSLMVIQQHPHF